ncbi:proton myo-inositol cotransporter-like isoform X2 [Macrobrachium nipponense]|uniref:proton myo-inositol cotransporter-like isoform X2 n=1 Tax=Macrobrachium nipponense TaxID=159736 RepID=UPI0030C86988
MGFKASGSLRSKMESIPKPMWMLIVFSAIGGFLFGYGTGVVSGAMILIKKEMNLSTLWHEIIVSATIASAWLSALIAGPTTNKYGRRYIILAASIIFLLGTLITGFALEKIMLLFGRIIVGLAIGLISMAGPVYLSESSTAEHRGCITIINNLFITGGQLVSCIVCGVFSGAPHGWRYMLGLGALPCVVQLAGFSFIPESPRWLVANGRVPDARMVLAKIRHPDADLEGELDVISAAVVDAKNQKATIREVLRSAPARRALLIGSLLQLFQQVTGINIVMYYSASIITMAGLRNESLAIWLAAAVSSINFFGTFIGLWLVDRLGRRFLIVTSLIGSAGALLLLALSFQAASVFSPPVDVQSNSTACGVNTCGECVKEEDCGYCFSGTTYNFHNSSCVLVDHHSHHKLSLEGDCANSTLVAENEVTFAYDWCPTEYAWIPVVGLALYLLFFAPGMGVMPWTVNSEIFPGWARSTCNSLTTAVNWGSNLIVSLTFLTLTETLDKHGAFYLYMTVAIIGVFIFYFFLPETRGVPLEEVEDLFTGPLLVRSPSGTKYKPGFENQE